MARKMQHWLWLLLSMGIVLSPGVFVPLGGVIAGG